MEAVTDTIRGLLQSYSKQDILLGVVIFQAICAVPFLICSIVVSGTANAGFNCVLTSFLNIAYVAGAFFVVRNSKAPIANLMTAIYWGQLSHCKQVNRSIAQYSCSNPTAYGAVSAFASLLFIAQTALVAIIVIWRAYLIQEVSTYVGIPRDEESVQTIVFNSALSTNPPPTADF
eukprot:scaffold26_cov159-Ochromonas_danica.AAC.3